MMFWRRSPSRGQRAALIARALATPGREVDLALIRAARARATAIAALAARVEAIVERQSP